MDAQTSAQQDAIKDCYAAWGTYLNKVNALNAVMFARPHLDFGDTADPIAIGREILQRVSAAQASVVAQWSTPLNMAESPAEPVRRTSRGSAAT